MLKGKKKSTNSEYFAIPPKLSLKNEGYIKAFLCKRKLRGNSCFQENKVGILFPVPPTRYNWKLWT